MSSSRPTTVVLGLDGGGFELIEPWIQSGALPNFQRAVQSGTTADLESVLPPTTSPNWRAYATGKNPGKLGIFWWENINTNSQRTYYPSHRKRAHTDFWEHIGKEESVGVLGTPLTYPPKPLDAFEVAGAPDGNDTGFAFPPELESYLKSTYDYRVTRNTRLQEQPQRAAEEVRELINLRFEAARDLLERYDLDFLQVTTFYLNSLHHFFWSDNQTRLAWQQIDEHLGTFLDEGYNVVVMSDHGSNEIKTVFHINTWLEKQGLLKTKGTEVASLLSKLGLDATKLKKILKVMHLEGPVKDIVPDSIINSVPTEEGIIPRVGKEQHIDWENSDVIASGQGPIYLNIDKDEPRYKKVRQYLIKELMELSTPEVGQVIRDIHRGEDIYSEEYPSETPDLVIDQAENVHIPGALGAEEVFSEPGEGSGWRGENMRKGLFIASGPDIGTRKLDTLSILDLAPTLLHLHDCYVPTDMDGDVRVEIFGETSKVYRREVEYRDVRGRELELAKARTIARRLDDYSI